jgi:hypothetical protein
MARPRSGTRQNVFPSTPPCDRHPSAIIARMSSRDSVRGSSAVRMDRVGVAPGDLGHEAAFFLVPFAGTAKHDDDAAAPHPPHRLNRFFQGVGGVGKVHDHQERLSLVNALHPPTEGGDTFQSGLDGVAVQTPGDRPGSRPRACCRC